MSTKVVYVDFANKKVIGQKDVKAPVPDLRDISAELKAMNLGCFKEAWETQEAGDFSFSGQSGAAGMEDYDVSLGKGLWVIKLDDDSYIIASPEKAVNSLSNHGDNKNQAARVRRLSETFRDKALYIGLLNGDSYAVLQYAGDVTEHNILDAEPIATMHAGPQAFEKHFTAHEDIYVNDKLLATFKNRSSLPIVSDCPVASVCSLKIKGVFEVAVAGFWGHGKQHFNKGDIIVQYEDSCMYRGGKPEDVLPTLTKMSPRY